MSSLKYSTFDIHRRYHLACKIVVKRNTFCNLGEDKKQEGKDYLLIPDDNSERDFFFGQYLDRINKDDDILNFNGIFASPVSKEAKVSLQRPDKLYPDAPYLYVQTKDVFEALEACQGRRIFFEILSEHDEAEKHAKARS